MPWLCPNTSAYVVFEREGDRLLADELIEFAPVGDEEGAGE